MRADMHIHTYYSDGLQSPKDVAQIAKANGVELISVTDHDTSLAYPEVFEECKKVNICAVYGIEVSAYTDGVRLHTLGYGMDYNSPIYKNFTKELRDGSIKRTQDILEKLEKHNIKISMEEVLKYRKCPDAPIHAMYISRAAAEKGYAPDPFTFQREFLSKGKIAYSGVCRPSPERAVEIITACGGVASLAHPGRIELDKNEVVALVERLLPLGLKGIEAEYLTHTQQETAYFTEMAKKYGLFVTGGSDTHFKEGKRRIGDPVFYCDKKLCERLSISK